MGQRAICCCVLALCRGTCQCCNCFRLLLVCRREQGRGFPLQVMYTSPRRGTTPYQYGAACQIVICKSPVDRAAQFPESSALEISGKILKLSVEYYFEFKA